MRYTHYIDSSQRSSGSNTDFDISLKEPIVHLSKTGQFIVSVINVTVPFSFYQLSNTDNLNQLPVFLKNASDPSGVNRTITLQPGNYTPYTLIQQLNQRLLEACLTASPGFTPFTPLFQTTYTPSTGYITFALTNPLGCEIRLLFSTNTTTALLGGFFGMGGVDVIMTPATTPTSVRPCLLNPVNYLFLRSSLKQFRNREFIVQKDDTSDILQRIPIGTAQGTWIQYDQPSEPVYIIDPQIQTINFYLTTNLSYTPINLQGLSWSFSFSISEVSRPEYQPIAEAMAINRMVGLSVEEREAMTKELESLRLRELERLQRYKEKLSKGDEKVKEMPEQEQGVRSPAMLEQSAGSRLLSYTPSQPYPNIFDDPQRQPETIYQEVQ